MKILKIDLEHLRDNEHYRMMESLLNVVQEEIGKADPENGGELNAVIIPLSELFQQRLETEQRAINRLRKNELTDPIADADTLRDNAFRGLMLYVKTYSLSPDEEKREAARCLQVLLENVGDFRRDNYEAESGTIVPFLNELERNHTENIKIIGAEEWVEALRDANNKFDELMNERSQQHAEKEPITGKEARRLVNKVYQQLITSIEVVYTVSDGGVYENLIDRINEIIGDYKTTLAQRKGRAKASKNASASGEEKGES